MIGILIMSCARDQMNGANDACRRTFLREWPVCSYRFVLGDGAIPVEDDELQVSASDAYGALQMKQRAAYEWARQGELFSHVFVAFTDTYIHVPRLLTSGYEAHDYMGLQVKHGGIWLSGGNGYWLSQRALNTILQAPNMPHKQGDEADGLTLSAAGYKTINDTRFGSTITRHLSKSTGVYNPAWMYETHKEFL